MKSDHRALHLIDKYNLSGNNVLISKKLLHWATLSSCERYAEWSFSTPIVGVAVMQAGPTQNEHDKLTKEVHDSESDSNVLILHKARSIVHSMSVPRRLATEVHLCGREL